MLSAPLAIRCPRCGYLPASATVICLQCGRDPLEADSIIAKENQVSMASRIGIFFIGVFLLVLFVAGCASVQQAPDVPQQLKPAANESLVMVMPAAGVQIYECLARKDGGYEWAFVAPEADLYDGHGVRIGHHGAGPHWESLDGSRVVGAAKERADAPSAGSIPWLLLAAKSVGREGSLSKVTSVQRLHTAGGVAPADGCSSAAAGKQARVGYTADYYFYVQQGTGLPDSAD